MVLVVVGPPEEGRCPVLVLDPHVVSRGDAVAAQRTAASQQVLELRVGVAPYTGIRRSTVCVLFHEVVNDVPREGLLHVEHVMGYTQRPCHPLGVHDSIEATARFRRTCLLRVAERLHGYTHHVVALLDEQGGRDRRVDATRHGDQDASGHDAAAASARRTTATVAAAAAWMWSAVVPWPKLKRTVAPRASSPYMASNT